ncbi:MAG: tetratricopeptide repeat protein [Termitinemataceae bacterium]|nr:MAG: tetratricopeptide repeat protein [Termitinemataceae bacterium]
MFSGYATSNYGTTIRRKQTLRTLVLLILLALILVGAVLLISVQKSRTSKDQRDLVTLWQKDNYRDVFKQSADLLEKKPLDYFLLSIHGFSAYQLAVAQINNADMNYYLDACIWALRNALTGKEHSRDARIFYVLGKAYYSKGADYAELAIHYLELAKKAGFNADDIPEYLGLSYALVKDYRMSIASFSEALPKGFDSKKEKIGGPNDALLLAIAKSYVELAEYDTASAYLAHCLEVSKDFNTIARARLLLGNIMLKEGRESEAEQQYLSVLKEGGEMAEARFWLGELYLLRKETTRARAEWRKAHNIDPDYTPAKARLGMAN